MDKNKKILRVGITAILLTMITCIGFVYYTRLKEPVFFTYCIAASAVPRQADNYSQPVLELQYITNRDDDRTIAGISFKEAPDFYFTATEYKPSNMAMNFFGNTAQQQIGENIGRYSLRKVYVYMTNFFQEDWEGELELHTATMMYNNGSTFETDLGKIILYSDRADNEGLSQVYSSSSNDDSASSSYEALKNITILELTSPIISEAAPLLNLQVEDMHYYNLSNRTFKKGERLSIYSSFRSAEGYLNLYDEYDIRPKLSYKTEDGSVGSIRIYNITHRKYFYDFWDLLSYLREREVF